jgi:hypothetical protein
LSCSLSGNSARKENIVESSYERADACVRAIGGTSSEHLSSFVTWLGSQQYSAGYAASWRDTHWRFADGARRVALKLQR